MQNTIRIATFNIHKGFTHFNARYALHHQRDLLQKLHADLIFLQEVQDQHIKHNQRLEARYTSGQVEYLADTIWTDYAYGKNSVYPAGHHGNALLSKAPIIKTVNQDISAHTVEQRGFLHCEINMPQWHMPLHTICVHLGLLARWRRRQLHSLADYVSRHIPEDSPMIIAGDFNDWDMRAGREFASQLQLHEVFEQHKGKPARSFPAWMPILRVDRIYVRGFEVAQADVHAGAHLLKVSDHAVLTATLRKL